MFVANCRKSFEPYEHIKSKPGRYGIKIWAAADVVARCSMCPRKNDKKIHIISGTEAVILL
nr:unnamed protein product [Callosobruchus chinensis]